MKTMRSKVFAVTMVGAFLLVLGGLAVVPSALADVFSFSTGDPDGKMATGSRPGSAGTLEIESADDFVLTSTTSITGATFTGLLPAGFSIQQVVVEIYRVFPNDSDVGRTSGTPTFSTSEVPTRVNSPSDVELSDRDTASGNLSFTTPRLRSMQPFRSPVLLFPNLRPCCSLGLV